ncbi:mak31p [Saccharomyces arboricola H-6]|uniref:Mak31p n=1 Tax=Saccharomyces arboricola (strain H-6 / AS 2.3317 / CBS 10644) TaxID=1160507 RepID=J8QA89_SACAR|nr:mak31p [Saccharomyces arboricola H-6]
MDILKLSDFIGNTLIVSLAEDRILIGVLVAVDAQMNLLLDHAEERIDSRSRKMGLVSVPRCAVQSIKITKPLLQHLTAKKAELMATIV